MARLTIGTNTLVYGLVMVDIIIEVVVSIPAIIPAIKDTIVQHIVVAEVLIALPHHIHTHHTDIGKNNGRNTYCIHFVVGILLVSECPVGLHIIQTISHKLIVANIF
jgi:hypothetical protein